ncbi:hypothetical protein [Sulfolobus islandicus rudivirus 1 variant XX]|uniref:Uncharacterized protein n=1 Tax=Sulfolobus islandicus rod-shaped virus 1 TaxID=157898 RepID=Q5TJ75_SIRV1|nr:hypothetical protein [Sulfolobus islandicus rudivirus 1 variant XX]
MRKIMIPGINVNKESLEILVTYNDEILVSHCYNKLPKYGLITAYGIVWNSLQELYRDAEEVCHYFYQLYIIYDNNANILALSHADEVFNQKLNPFINKPIQK